MIVMRTARPRAARGHGFTLIELLTVVAIIVLLAGIILGTFGYVNKKLRSDRTRAEIEALSTAVNAYYLDADNGIYPASYSTSPAVFTNLPGATSNSVSLYIALSGNTNGTGLAPNPPKRAYFPDLRTGRDGNIAQTAGGQYYFIDPYGYPVNYLYPGVSNRVTCDIISPGADGLYLTSDDITNNK